MDKALRIIVEAFSTECEWKYILSDEDRFSSIVANVMVDSASPSHITNMSFDK